MEKKTVTTGSGHTVYANDLLLRKGDFNWHPCFSCLSICSVSLYLCVFISTQKLLEAIFILVIHIYDIIYRLTKNLPDFDRFSLFMPLIYFLLHYPPRCPISDSKLILGGWLATLKLLMFDGYSDAVRVFIP